MSRSFAARTSFSLLAAFGFVALQAGCERVSYYSFGGETTDPTGPEPSDVTVGPGGGEGENVVTRGMVLEGVATCAVSLYADFEARAVTFAEAAEAFADDPTDENRDAARAAWRETIGAWQQAEIIRVGPAAQPSIPGGRGLRDLVYSWPLVSRCLVEQRVVSRAYEDENFGQTALINTRGLAAAEYLLFYEGTDHGCGPNSSLETTGSWAALGAQELAARKRAYAAVVAADVVNVARSISEGWAARDGGFATVLADAGGSGSPFASEQAALNVLSDGLFYVEVELKDMKLGRPLGKMDCAEATCPDAVESQYAGAARDHIKNNLLGFRRVFAGCDEASATGFDDLLRSVGAGELANEMVADVDAAVVASDALATSDLVEALASDKAGVEALHAAVKQVTDALKTEFVGVLDLQPPMNVEGDND